MAERRRYTKRQKLATVMAAEMAGITQTAETTGIPHQTISYWMDDPAFSEVRRKAREDLVEEVKVAAHLAWKRVVETLPQMEPRDAIFAAEKASSILQLLSGYATSRMEHRDITAMFDDHERDALAKLLRDAAESEAVDAGDR